MVMTRRGWHRVAIALGIALASVAVFLAVFDWNWLKGPIERTVSSATGRGLDIEGNITGQWRLQPRVRLERVRFANPGWAQNPNLLTAEVVELQIALIPLLRGRVHLLDLLLVKPVVALERVADGRATWLFDREQRDGDSAPRIDALHIDSGSLDYLDEPNGTQLKVGVQDTGSSNAADSLQYTINGRFRRQAVALKGSSPALQELRGASELPIKVAGTVAGTHVELQGTIDNLALWQQLNLRYVIRGGSLKRLAPVFGVPLPETPAYAVSGMLVRSGPRWASSDMKGTVGKSDLAGQVVVVTGGARPDLVAQLTSNLLDLADLGPLIGTRPAEAPASAADLARVLPSRPFDFSGADTLNAKVTLTAKQVVRAGDFPFDDFRAEFILKDAQITIDPLDFGMAGGKLRAKVALDARKPVLAATLSGRMRDVNVAKIFPDRKEVGEAAGSLSGSFDLRAQGNSVSAILGTSDGRARLLLTDGRVPSLLPAIADLDGARIIASFLGKRPEFVQCSAIDLALQRGIATPAVAVFETESTVLNLTGSINLGNERLDLKMVQAPKEASFLSMRTPILITGTMKTPAFAPDPVPLVKRTAAALLLGLINPLAALFATIETGPGKEGSCQEIRGGLRLKPAVDTGAPEKSVNRTGNK